VEKGLVALEGELVGEARGPGERGVGDVLGGGDRELARARLPAGLQDAVGDVAAGEGPLRVGVPAALLAALGALGRRAPGEGVFHGNRRGNIFYEGAVRLSKL
jgi:hypothetical protein